MKQWCVYIVRCKDDTLYTGVSNDIEHRLQLHNSGRGAKYTKFRTPVTLVYKELSPDRSTAQKREYVLKQLSREEKNALCYTE